MNKIITIFFCLLLFISSPSNAKHAWQVIDGDTIRHGETVIRFWGIDAPEINQRCLKADGVEYKCGQDSKTALEVLIQDKPLVCEYINKDRYDRDIARCKVDGLDIGGLMVSLGWAVDYERYSKGRYKIEQYQAQKQSLDVRPKALARPPSPRKDSHAESAGPAICAQHNL